MIHSDEPTRSAEATDQLWGSEGGADGGEMDEVVLIQLTAVDVFEQPLQKGLHVLSLLGGQPLASTV